MKKLSSSALKNRRQAILRKLPRLEKILRGSLIERFKPCGNPSCRCAHGRGHGPKYYLSVTPPSGRPQMDYVPLDFYKETKKFLSNYRLAREMLEEICEINRELLRRREKL
jgi:hypothetical protein